MFFRAPCEGATIIAHGLIQAYLNLPPQEQQHRFSLSPGRLSLIPDCWNQPAGQPPDRSSYPRRERLLGSSWFWPSPS